jgi:hypothetical protein
LPFRKLGFMESVLTLSGAIIPPHPEQKN